MIKQIRGFAKRISEGEKIPVEEMRALGLWHRWVFACRLALREVATRLGVTANDILVGHPVAEVAYQIRRVELFADESRR